MTEVYGFNRTRQAIWTAVISTVLFGLFTQIAIILPSAGFWEHQSSFETVFHLSWRLALAGCLAWVVGEFANSYVVAKMKISQNAKNMSLRFIGSTVVGQFFDTAVFMFVAFAGTMPWNSFFVMLFTAWGFKIGYEILALPLSVPITKWVKKLEGVEHFDNQDLRIL